MEDMHGSASLTHTDIIFDAVLEFNLTETLCTIFVLSYYGVV